MFLLCFGSVKADALIKVSGTAQMKGKKYLVRVMFEV